MKPSDYLKIGWCQGMQACNRMDSARRPDAPDATAWCLLGAMSRLSLTDMLLMQKEVRLILKLKPAQSISGWNDSLKRKRSEVITLAEQAERRMGL